MSRHVIALFTLSALAAAPPACGEPARVQTLRLPAGAVQPQVALSDDGAAHCIFYTGDPRHGDIQYVRFAARDKAFGKGLAVNHHAGSAIAVGNIRGAHLALGRNGRVHVAWMGADKSQPKAPGGATPMLYTRMNDEGTEFEKERNVITRHVGLDGGGSLAADPKGNVYVVWHAPSQGSKGEVNRRVWVAHSGDDGLNFEPERMAFDRPVGCCGCCGIRALADRAGRLFVLFRSAEQSVDRDMWLLASNDQSQTFVGTIADRWPIDTCVMSTAALTDTADGVLAAWETQGQVYFGRVDARRGGGVAGTIAAPGAGGDRKYPVVAENAQGDVLLAWTEGMSWERGGAVAWQVYGADGRPIAGELERAEGVPPWSLVAVFARPNGSFAVVY